MKDIETAFIDYIKNSKGFRILCNEFLEKPEDVKRVRIKFLYVDPEPKEEWLKIPNGATREIQDKPKKRLKAIEDINIVKKRKGEITRED